MKAIRILLLVATLAGFYLFAGFTPGHSMDKRAQARTSAEQVLTAVHEKLSSSNILQYAYQLELHYLSEDYHRTLSGTAFLEFTAADSITGFRYQLKEDGKKLVYNGTESFVLDEGQNSMQLTIHPKLAYFTSMTAFHNSLVTLRKAIPAIIQDRTIGRSLADTTIENRSFHLVRLTLDKRVIERLGGFSDLSTDRKIIYEMVVDKSSFLPVQFIQRNNINSDYMLSVFRDVVVDAVPPAELSWYYSSYTDRYKLARQKELLPLKVQATAPDWQLPLHGGREEVQLSRLKGRVVLLEFWTRNCGYCITVVPKINSLVEKFQQEDVKVLGVNPHDSEEDIGRFYQKNRPNYQTVFKGKGIADVYGIGYFPAIVLLDKKGNVLYQGEYNQAAIERLITAALK